MSDTTDKALDALQEWASVYRYVQNGVELNPADQITALRVERDRWAVMVGRIVACLPLEDIDPETATMGELIDEIKDGLAERDALRAQLEALKKAEKELSYHKNHGR
jgi:hypothetical protein